MTQIEKAKQVLIDFGCDAKTAARLAGSLSRRWDEQKPATTTDVEFAVIEAEIVDDECQGGYRVCTGVGTLREDPYEADVNNTPDQMIVICDACYQELSDDI